MIGTPVDEWGTLVREGGAFTLRRDGGGTYELRLHRMPVDHIAKRVRVRGTLIGDGVVEVDGVSASGAASAEQQPPQQQ